MNTFPTLSRSPGMKGYTEVLSDDSVLTGSTASGYPVRNELFTFDPITFQHTLFLVSQADKETVITFYKANKDIPFYWPNAQDSLTYEVEFVQKPVCRMDGVKDRWRIDLVLRQSSSATS